LSSSTLPLSGVVPQHRRSWKSIALVFICTLLGAVAQMLIKTGANTITHKSVVDSLLGMFASLPLFTGYCLYGISMVLLVLALRHGELSQLYPVIALTFVWVCLLSIVWLHEPMNVYKVSGVALIVAGVAVLGRGGR
jgi:multidrug transporter EmrE-like cation transporter